MALVKNKKIIPVAIVILIMCVSIKVNAMDDIVELDKGSWYTSDNINNMALNLSKRYPEIIRYELLGYSFDSRPIFSITMTEGNNQINNLDDFNIERQHYLTIAGTHAREDVNPILVMKIIEEYAKAYYGTGYYGAYNVREVLNRSVLHFLPNTNPDGFDLVRQGSKAVKTDGAKKSLENLSLKNYSNLKSNMRGVDLNRNFPSVYINQSGEAKEMWGDKNITNHYRSKPGAEFFHGFSPGSEAEKKVMMDYMKRYDHRNVTSIHSRGQILFWFKPLMSAEFNQRASRLAQAISNVSGYKPTGAFFEKNAIGSGYESDYSATVLNKPLITVETLPARTKLPTEQRFYKVTFEEVKYIPLESEAVGRKEGYLKFRLYIEGKYIRDYSDEKYAQLNAKQDNGIVVQGNGLPLKNLDGFVSRIDFLEILLKESLESHFEKKFDKKEIVEFASKNKIINSTSKGLARPNDLITTAEASIMVKSSEDILKQILMDSTSEKNVKDNMSIEESEQTENIENIEDKANKLKNRNIPMWAFESVRYVVEKGYININAFSKDKIYLEIKYFDKISWKKQFELNSKNDSESYQKVLNEDISQNLLNQMEEEKLVESYFETEFE